MPAKKRVVPIENQAETPTKKLKTEQTRRSQRIAKNSESEAPNGTSKAISKAPTKAEKDSNPVEASLKKDATKSKSATKPADKPKTPKKDTPTPADILPRPAYWLMKAEPESRIEKGKDVKFSIDDLAATDKEAWDGVRNLVARNNMRAMKKGERAFFYHSNCKIPGIAGIMEIEDEHSVDESAFNPDHPYYDEKGDRENPKWSVVHVKFLKKLDSLVSLKELQRCAQAGAELGDMQVLRMSRLSVSKVTKQQWDFICRELAKIDPDSLDPVS